MLKHLQSNEEFQQKSLAAKGFTLIELLVVIVILGILAAVVVFAVSGITDRGDTSACKTDKRTMLTAIEAWNASPRVAPTATAYPTSEEALRDAGFIQDVSTKYSFASSSGASRPTLTVEDSKCTGI